MADESDVGNKLVALIGAIAYPNGTGQPSIANADVRIYRGWPVSAQLDADMAAGKAHISVFAPAGMERNTTRYGSDEIEAAAPVHTLTATVAANTITIGGTVSTPQNIIVLCGTRHIFPYSVRPGDTLNGIAANLAAAIAQVFPDTVAAGPAITIAPEPGLIRARVAGQGTVFKELGRQEKTFFISCWCPTPAMRDILAPAVDVALRQMDFITLIDQSSARLRYGSSRTSDEGQKVQIYRRDLLYTVEYPTSIVAPAFEVGALGVNTTPGDGDSQITYF